MTVLEETKALSQVLRVTYELLKGLSICSAKETLGPTMPKSGAHLS